jgi:hypothetical protein
MQTVPPVAVDVILDPYILNVFPKSLTPTASYILLVALAAWFLSGWVSRLLIAPAPELESDEPKKSR